MAFKERYLAEKFMFGPRDIPSVGQVQLTWVPNPPITLPASGANSGPGSDTNKTGSDEDTVMDNATGPSMLPEQSGARKDGPHDVDYDVAEVDDSWGVE